MVVSRVTCLCSVVSFITTGSLIEIFPFLFSCCLYSVPTFTVHPGVARPPSPLMIIHNTVDDDDDNDEDEDDDDDDEPSVPLEQYRAWLGKLKIEPVDTV